MISDNVVRDRVCACVCARVKLCKQLVESFDTIRHQYWNYVSAGIAKQLQTLSQTDKSQSTTPTTAAKNNNNKNNNNHWYLIM